MRDGPAGSAWSSRRSTRRSIARSRCCSPDEREAALRWSAAVVEQQDASVPSALILTCRLLADVGPHRGGDRGLRARREARDRRGQPPARGRRGRRSARARRRRRRRSSTTIAAAFCVGSPRLTETRAAAAAAAARSRASSRSARSSPGRRSSRRRRRSSTRRRTSTRALARRREPPLISPLPLFSALEKEGLRALIGCFEMITVPAGKHVIDEGEEGAEAYIVARGELEVRRERQTSEDGRERDHARAPRRTARSSARWRSSRARRAPRASSRAVRRSSSSRVATRSRPSPRSARTSASSSRRTAVGAWSRTSCARRSVLLAVDPNERPALVERFETRVFEKGEKLIDGGQGHDRAAPHRLGRGRGRRSREAASRSSSRRSASASRSARSRSSCAARRTRTSSRCTRR